MAVHSGNDGTKETYSKSQEKNSQSNEALHNNAFIEFHS